MVENAEEQGQIAEMRTMHSQGATLRQIGGRFGKHPMHVKRILDR